MRKNKKKKMHSRRLLKTVREKCNQAINGVIESTQQELQKLGS